MGPTIAALLGTLLTYACVAVGAALVYQIKDNVQAAWPLAVAGGFMLSAATDLAAEASGFLPCILGVLVAIGFVIGMDAASDALLRCADLYRGSNTNDANRSALTVAAAITMHHIPEALAIGVAFAAAHDGTQWEPRRLAAALSVSAAVSVQCVPEGFAAAVLIKHTGLSARWSFILGQATGVLMPVAGVIGALAASASRAAEPFALMFASGTMVLVVCTELLPRLFGGGHGHTASGHGAGEGYTRAGAGEGGEEEEEEDGGQQAQPREGGSGRTSGNTRGSGAGGGAAGAGAGRAGPGGLVSRVSSGSLHVGVASGGGSGSGKGMQEAYVELGAREGQATSRGGVGDVSCSSSCCDQLSEHSGLLLGVSFLTAALIGRGLSEALGVG